MSRELAVREADERDEALLLEWRNEPEVRRQSFRGEPISPDRHRRWFRDRLARRDASRIYVGELDGTPVGQARIDMLEDGTAEISVAVAPVARGHGVGRALIAAATERAAADLDVRSVVALVKRTNPASLSAFAAAGYRESVVSGRGDEDTLVLTWRPE